MQEELSRIKLIVALKAARAIIGWNQEEFAAELGVAKSTIARYETGEADVSFSEMVKIVSIYQRLGVNIDIMDPDALSISVHPKGLTYFKNRLEDDSLRRSDRRRPKKS